MINFNTKTLSSNPIFSHKKNLFSIEECEQIISLFPKLSPNHSLTAGGMNIPKRASSNCWIPFGADFNWIYERIALGSKDCNPWELSLRGMFEQIQLTHYADEEYYNWHQDAGYGEMSLRKLSAVINLSNPDSYQGADLEFIMAQKEDHLREQGTAIYFPSYQVHRVTPCFEGQRFSLVCWISGEPFK